MGESKVVLHRKYFGWRFKQFVGAVMAALKDKERRSASYDRIGTRKRYNNGERSTGVMSFKRLILRRYCGWKFDRNRLVRLVDFDIFDDTVGYSLAILI